MNHLLIKPKVPVKIVFINGPSGSGKDTAGEILCKHGSGRRLVMKMSMEIKERTHAAFRIVDAGGRPVPHDYFEDQKEVPQACFLGLTPRQAYIEFSERFYKPLFGQDIFGRLLATRMELTLEHAHQTKGFTHIPDAFTITDSGFAEETKPIIDMFDAENCTLLRLHRDGYDFSGDSRSYIDAPTGVRTIDVHNAGNNVAEFKHELETVAPHLFTKVIV